MGRLDTSARQRLDHARPGRVGLFDLPGVRHRPGGRRSVQLRPDVARLLPGTAAPGAGPWFRCLDSGAAKWQHERPGGAGRDPGFQRGLPGLVVNAGHRLPDAHRICVEGRIGQPPVRLQTREALNRFLASAPRGFATCPQGHPSTCFTRSLSRPDSRQRIALLRPWSRGQAVGNQVKRADCLVVHGGGLIFVVHQVIEPP